MNVGFSEFSFELPLCGVQRTFIFFKQPFWHRPGSFIFPDPKRPAWMDKQHFQLTVPEPEKHDPAAV